MFAIYRGVTGEIEKHKKIVIHVSYLVVRSSNRVLRTFLWPHITRRNKESSMKTIQKITPGFDFGRLLYAKPNAMCKAIAESNSQVVVDIAAGLNSGILYLMIFPYLIIGAVAYAFYRQRKAKKA